MPRSYIATIIDKLNVLHMYRKCYDSKYMGVVMEKILLMVHVCI